ncbi:hypothetical protein ASPWEDRAFT_175780 [Aspergillus wentii DTO 134E9]|uniref:PAC domain-containing protein n=1 Tax=Aspergillus wentii DTO 134E9 TaxID=1073089 RepID=A0A1L9RC44_ASPWE|nr:uncharacterized protein ASPWEDRAFT_175780 [Aspergillus wentii DTO 134E9]KAI9935060.1 hypothetical protein MW887_000681 [Aspergillus wentii]OJJ32499.1 hypothetical protein ASPWEDRAFT_175780 [Aspergillus wentii DTO 134E9]
MEIPDFVDSRPGSLKKPPSVLSFTPTVHLDAHLRDSDSYSKKSHHDDAQSRTSYIPDFPHPPPTNSELSSKTSAKHLRRNFAVNELPLLQEINPYEESDQFNPVNEAGLSYDLVAPYEGDGSAPLHSLERQADIMFSSEHMLGILTNPRYLARFREFLVEERPRSVPTLTYYLNACKALKALNYANALVRLSIDVPTPGISTADQPVGDTRNSLLEQRVDDALSALTAEELPAFITSNCINITSKVVEERVRGTLPDKFQGTADALAEVFCLTDPSRPDNPIIFASEEFHRTTQYGMDYVLGRNCRFLQGPKTNQNSVRRIREGIQQGRHHSELFLNYRRDGSPFMNLLQCAPLCDSQGKIRYFIGAQIDVSGLAMEGAQMESLQGLQAEKEEREERVRSMKSAKSMLSEQHEEDEETIPDPVEQKKSEFQELNELFSPRELMSVHEHGGNLFQPTIDPRASSRSGRTWRVPDYDSEDEDANTPHLQGMKLSNPNVSLTGVYEHYLLVRPYPSLRVLFTSPSLQIPGMLQSSFFSRIGGSASVRDDLLHAMMAGRSVTARIKWVTRFNDQGRNRWVHCTPLLANNGEVGVWMVVIVDDEDEHVVRWKGNWPTA